MCNFSILTFSFPFSISIFISEMMTVPSRSQSSPDSSVDIETDTEYLKIAKKGGGHKG